MKKFFWFIFVYYLFCSYSFASNEESFVSDLSIKELNQNVEKLKEEKTEFQIKTKELSKEYGELISFIKSDLSDLELSEIKINIDDFLSKRNIIQDELKEKMNSLLPVEEEKKDLILIRVQIYRYLAKYVSKEKREDFVEHIKFKIQSEKESKDLIEELLKNQFLLDQKVTYIREKIEDHKEDLQAKIDVSITSKIKQRIFEIDRDPKYINIDLKAKNKIYNDFINLIKEKLKEIENSSLSDNYKEIRKNILNIMIAEIQSKIIDIPK